MDFFKSGAEPPQPSGPSAFDVAKVGEAAETKWMDGTPTPPLRPPPPRARNRERRAAAVDKRPAPYAPRGSMHTTTTTHLVDRRVAVPG